MRQQCRQRWYHHQTNRTIITEQQQQCGLVTVQAMERLLLLAEDGKRLLKFSERTSRPDALARTVAPPWRVVLRPTSVVYYRLSTVKKIVLLIFKRLAKREQMVYLTVSSCWLTRVPLSLLCIIIITSSFVIFLFLLHLSPSFFRIFFFVIP
jgi:hypothetical protein